VDQPSASSKSVGSAAHLVGRRDLISGAACASLIAVGHPRIAQRQSGAAAAPDLRDLLEARTARLPSGSLPYRLLRPGSDESGKRPLVILLHGSGAIGSDNAAQLGPLVRSWATDESRRRFPSFVVAPQVSVRSVDYGPDSDELPSSRPGPAYALILEFVDWALSTLPIDCSRVYVMGFSMGGSTALRLLLDRPRTFAGAVALGAVPPPRSRAPEAVYTPVLLVHGEEDSENPAAGALAWAHALRAAGGGPTARLYPGVGHQPPPDFLAAPDWQEWLFAQARSEVQVVGRDKAQT